MTYFAPHRTALIIFGIALVVRLFFLPFSFFEAPPAWFPGALAFDGYYELATHLMSGDGYRRIIEPPYNSPDSMRMPLYPAFILVILTLFGSYKALFLIQALIGSFTAVLSWIFAKEFVSSRLAIAVGMLMALEPLNAYLTSVILTETLFSPVFLFALFLVVRYLKTQHLPTLALSACMLGISVYIKPTVQYLPFCILIVFWNAHRFRFPKLFFKEIAVMLGIFFLMLTPWMYRNYTLFGTTELVVQSVLNINIALVPSVISLETGESFEAALARYFAQEGIVSFEEIGLDTRDHFSKIALAEIKQHPRGLAQSIGITAFAFFTHDGYATILDRRGVAVSFERPPLSTLLTSPVQAFTFAYDLLHKPEALVLLGRIFWILTTFAAFAGLALYIRVHGITPEILLVSGTVAYFMLTTAVLGLAVNGRFRLPVEPIVFIFAVYCLSILIQRLRRI